MGMEGVWKIIGGEGGGIVSVSEIVGRVGEVSQGFTGGRSEV
jgi:hypothetical protein